jgi:glycosyltransferase involved in cell wall biosynthesis
MVSVIVVTCNRADLLFKCLNSIVNQTYNQIEIIVIDDGSTDNSREIVENFNDNRIVYIYHEKTGNVSMLRNSGIRISKGELIAFCDDDDLWMENKLEVLLEYMKVEKIVCSNANVIDKNDKVLFDQITKFDSDRYVDLYQLLVDNRIQTSCVIVRKDVLLDAGLFDVSNGNRSEDWCVWIKIAEKFNIKYVNKSLVSYRIHDNNLSMKSFSDMMELAQRNIEILLPYLNHPDKNIVKSARKGLSLIYRKMTNLNYRNGNYNISLKYCRKFIAFHDNRLSLVHLKYCLLLMYLILMSLFEKKSS